MNSFKTIQDYFGKLDFKLSLSEENNTDNTFDFLIHINEEPLYVTIKKEVRPGYLHVLNETFEQKNNLLLVADYITPLAKEKLKERHINYIDSFGNAYLSLEKVKIYIEKSNAKPIVNESTEVFTPTGAKLLFELLQHPEHINTTYRDLAEACAISLGSVSKIMKALVRDGYAVRVNKTQLQLVKRKELLERWIPLINEKVLPTYKVGNFNFIKNNNWKNIDLEVQWGGEPGAALLNQYLNPEKFSLFTNHYKNDIIKNGRLLPNPNGEVAIYKPFWKNQENRTVSPLLIYAQLMYSGKDRNIETAKLIYDEYIKPKL
ncbi:type IV toxin-antitoxin system AbiEi family antitoxin [Flavobacterium crassostreae]|uniref:Uncharacterized protein n=1 Tax=Flavobacterium crassostreae TaxID=1763534 RepID=A0A1B9DWE9_9FLAO|nr:type IV toxin-antitoxin system AbiEi family antitoxin [Flavobacterium crassostreae]OCB74007.1 hypothetical protein LPBF_11130 [Flavobacterium crassostreae]